FVAMAGGPRPFTASQPGTDVDARPQGRAWRFWGLVKPAFVLDEARDLVEAAPDAQIAEDERARAAHAFGVALHHLQRRADMGREVDLVDDQEIGPRDARAALRRDFLAGGDVDDID